jgi:hypothetical protein
LKRCFEKLKSGKAEILKSCDADRVTSFAKASASQEKLASRDYDKLIRLRESLETGSDLKIVNY